MGQLRTLIENLSEFFVIIRTGSSAKSYLTKISPDISYLFFDLKFRLSTDDYFNGIRRFPGFFTYFVQNNI
jgi:hypothetical protein